MAELIFWVVSCVVALLAVLLGPSIYNLIQGGCATYIEDLPNWKHNYAKLQRRY